MNYKKNTELKYNRSLIKKYIQQSNYITSLNEESNVLEYDILPEAYNIFSSLNEVKFDNDIPQEALINKCLLELKRLLMMFYKKYGIRKELPKTKYFREEDNEIVLSWEYSNYRLFMSFEHNKDFGYLGMMIKNTNDNIFTNTSKLTKKNYMSLMNKVAEMMVNN